MFVSSNDITYCKVLSDRTHIFKASNTIRSLFLFLLTLLIPLNQLLSCGRSIILANLLVRLKIYILNENVIQLKKKPTVPKLKTNHLVIINNPNI